MVAGHTTRLAYPSLLQDPSLSSRSRTDGMDTGAIVGLVVGVVTALLLSIGIWLVYRRRQRLRNGFHLDNTDLEGRSIGMEPLEDPSSPCTYDAPPHKLSSELSSPNFQPGDYSEDPKDHIRIAIYLPKQEQEDTSSCPAKKISPYPDSNLTVSLFSDCKLFGGSAGGDLQNLYMNPANQDEIQEFFATTQQHHDGETSIDAIIYDEQTDAKTLKMIMSVSAPKVSISKLKQSQYNELISEATRAITKTILEVQQQAGGQAGGQCLHDLPQSQPDQKRRSSLILDGVI